MRAIQPRSSLPFGMLALLVNQTPGMAYGKGLYATEAETRQRAVEIGCTSVHENNGRWMACADERQLHQQLRTK